MIYIDFEGKTPVDTFPGWQPWEQKDWDDWLSKSEDLLQQLIRLNEVVQQSDGTKYKEALKARNDYIDQKSAHWKKLKPWLQALSHGKCWFSEVRELYSDYDVEHFRPKKESKRIDGKTYDGYWWLAFEYTNYRLCGNVGNRKKGGWFPLRKDSMISTFDNQCEESEFPYLLDPTDPADPELLAFDEEGNAIPSPLCKNDDWATVRAEETIARLKLTEHEALTSARREIWQEIHSEVNLYLIAKYKLKRGCNPALREKVKNHLKKIKKFTASTAELSSVAKWCIYFINDPQLLRIIA